MKQNTDLFAWSAADMLDIDLNFICHKFFIFSKAKLVAQRQGKLDEERRHVMKKESEKLLKVGFIREVKYSTWLSNVAMVKKPNRKWRVWVDHTNLNKASQRTHTCS